MSNKINAILTGATGMVGEGVLHECLQDPSVFTVLVINRRPCGVTHWMYPFLRFAFSGTVSTLAELGLAMIHSVTRGYDKQILEVKDIVTLAK